MNFTRSKEKLDNISSLPDIPKAVDGYTPSLLKAEFDKAALALQGYINNILLCQLEGAAKGASGAELIGSAKIDGLSGNTVYEQLCSLKENLALAANAAIPNGVLTREKLSPLLLNELDRLSTLSLKSLCYSQAGNYEFVAPAKGLYRFMAVGAGSGGTHFTNIPDSHAMIDARGGASGAFCRFDVWLEAGTRVSLKVGAASSPADGFTLNSVMSREQYLERISEEGVYASGEATQIFIGNGKSVICHGGDCRKEKTSVALHGVEGAITLSGRRYKWDDDRIVSCGADSAIGQGATDDFLPGAGAGGLGGVLYFDSDGSVAVRRLATKGGDGMIIVEYIGGQ